MRVRPRSLALIFIGCYLAVVWLQALWLDQWRSGVVEHASSLRTFGSGFVDRRRPVSNEERKARFRQSIANAKLKFPRNGQLVVDGKGKSPRQVLDSASLVNVEENKQGTTLSEARKRKFQQTLQETVDGKADNPLKGTKKMDPEIQAAQPKLVDLPARTSALPSVDSRIIFFLHIHKSAGTTMCHAASANRQNVTRTNCNVQSDQRCCGGNDTLAAQQQFAAQTNLTFVANERDMYASMDGEHYRYVVMLRDSQSRYHSHWKNVCRNLLPRFRMPFADWWQGQPDNWNVRKLCGTACADVPKFRISRALFAYTLDRLEQFEDILLVERFNETFTAFASHVGWNKMPVRVHHVHNITYPSDSAPWDPLMSSLDDALYQYAEKLYQIKQAGHDYRPTRVFSEPVSQSLERYFTDGPLRNLRTFCGNTACSVY